MRKKIANGLTYKRINIFWGVAMVAILILSGILYWLDQITGIGLILLAVAIFIGSICFSLGTTVAEKDGFVNGYAHGKDNSEKKKE